MLLKSSFMVDSVIAKLSCLRNEVLTLLDHLALQGFCESDAVVVPFLGRVSLGKQAREPLKIASRRASIRRCTQ